jgi:hypothetical protein
MKKKSVITEKCFRISGHKITTICMIEEGENVRFEIRQVFSDLEIPCKNERIKITGSALKLELDTGEFSAIVYTGLDLLQKLAKAREENAE